MRTVRRIIVLALALAVVLGAAVPSAGRGEIPPGRYAIGDR